MFRENDDITRLLTSGVRFFKRYGHTTGVVSVSQIISKLGLPEGEPITGFGLNRHELVLKCNIENLMTLHEVQIKYGVVSFEVKSGKDGSAYIFDSKSVMDLVYIHKMLEDRHRTLSNLIDKSSCDNLFYWRVNMSAIMGAVDLAISRGPDDLDGAKKLLDMLYESSEPFREYVFGLRKHKKSFFDAGDRVFVPRVVGIAPAGIVDDGRDEAEVIVDVDGHGGDGGGAAGDAAGLAVQDDLGGLQPDGLDKTGGGGVVDEVRNRSTGGLDDLLSSRSDISLAELVLKDQSMKSSDRDLSQSRENNLVDDIGSSLSIEKNIDDDSMGPLETPELAQSTSAYSMSPPSSSRDNLATMMSPHQMDYSGAGRRLFKRDTSEEN